jgi:hypothetical protein
MPEPFQVKLLYRYPLREAPDQRPQAGHRPGVDPMELLRMINGKVVQTKAVLSC